MFGPSLFAGCGHLAIAHLRHCGTVLGRGVRRGATYRGEMLRAEEPDGRSSRY